MLLTDWLRRSFRDTKLIRAAAMQVVALGRDPGTLPACLVTVMYHDMPPAACAPFARQLRYMRSLGEFITADQVVELLSGRKRFDRRYFCVTFDDGYHNAYRHAVPVLRDLGIPSIFFVVPKWLSQEPAPGTDRHYMDWEECGALHEDGVSIGSHSLSHRRLSLLDRQTARDELQTSKAIIEQRLGSACEHFAVPWGQPGEDYLPMREPLLAVELGYRSFFTTLRGPASIATSPWEIPRIRLEPDWQIAQLRAAFTRRPYFVDIRDAEPVATAQASKTSR